jgi:MFS family permease
MDFCSSAEISSPPQVSHNPNPNTSINRCYADSNNHVYVHWTANKEAASGQSSSGSGSSGAALGNEAQAALALAGIIGSIASTATSVLGGLGPCDRSRRLVIGLTATLTGISAGVMALTHSFQVFLLLSALNGVFTGLAAAPTAALTADVLPSEADDDTTAADPARDANLFTLAGTLPSTVLPLIGAALPSASHPQQRARVYRTFFWTQAALSIGSIWMLAWVDPWSERANDACSVSNEWGHDSSATRYGRPGGYGVVPTDYSKGHTVRARANRS